jgi:hypothetical protein
MRQHSFNRNRAGWAAVAVTAFRHETGITDDDETAILDLISDLGHLADKLNIDFIALVSRALSYWRLEQKFPNSIEAGPSVHIVIEEAQS